MKTIRKFSHRGIQFSSRVKDTKIKKKEARSKNAIKSCRVPTYKGEIDSPLSTHAHIYVFPSKALKCFNSYA